MFKNTFYSDCGCNGYNNIPTLSTNCGTCAEDVGCIPVKTECIIYEGEPLLCSGVENGDNLTEIITKFNTVLCINSGEADYSQYDTKCLSLIGLTDTQQNFVETISTFVCDNKTEYDEFVNTTYVTFVNEITTTVNDILNPGTTGCTNMVIAPGATIQTILQTLSSKICALDAHTSISTINWNLCLTAISTPSTIKEAFEEVLRQICIVNSNTGPVDTYKVKLSAADLTEDYIKVKLAGSTCIAINEFIDVDLKSKLQFGLTFVPKAYNFNPVYFTSTLGTMDGCTQTYNISLNPDIIGGDPYELTCSDLKGVFLPSATLPEGIYGSNVGGECASFTNCQLREFTFGGFTSGQYIVTINNAGATSCDRVSLIPFTGGLTYTPSLVTWDNCDPCKTSPADPVTLEESFQNVLDKLCCIYNIVIADTANKSYYVDGNVAVTGDGSVLKPFKTLAEARTKIIGTGSISTPENTNITVKVASSNYTSNINLFINTAHWEFEDGTNLLFNGLATQYLIDTTGVTALTKFNVSGKWNCTLSDGGFANIDYRTVNNAINIEFNNITKTTGSTATDPSTNPVFRIDGGSAAAYTYAAMALTVHGMVTSDHYDIISSGTYVRLYVVGTNPSSRLFCGSASPGDGNIAQRAIRMIGVENTTPADNLYSQEIIIKDIAVACNGDQPIEIGGQQGQITLDNVRFTATQLANIYQKRAIYVNPTYLATFSGGFARSILIRNCVFESIYTLVGGICEVINTPSVTDVDYHRVEMHNNLLFPPLEISKTIKLNSIIQGGYNSLTRFNISSVPSYIDNAAATSAGLEIGDIYHTAGALKIVT